MALNFTTFESTLQTKLNATTDPKEMLLLGKAIESTIGNMTVSDVQAAGATQVASVNSAGTTQVASVNNAGATQVSAVQAQGALQVSNVQAAAQGLAPLASPAFTGTPTAPTAASGTNTTQVATTAFVSSAVANLVSSAPDALNTLNELAAALGSDPNFATTVNTALANRVVKDAPVLGGNLNGAGFSYTNLHPAVTTITTAIDLNAPHQKVVLSANTTFTESNKAEGKTTILKLDRSASSFTPSFSANVRWAGNTAPSWADARYWLINMTCHDGTTVFASATSHTI